VSILYEPARKPAHVATPDRTQSANCSKMIALHREEFLRNSLNLSDSNYFPGVAVPWEQNPLKRIYQCAIGSAEQSGVYREPLQVERYSRD